MPQCGLDCPVIDMVTRRVHEAQAALKDAECPCGSEARSILEKLLTWLHQPVNTAEHGQ